jgi:hypothetical protein
MHKFQLALEDCGLVDLGYKGDTFTRRNRSHKKEKYIRERLDRAVANSAWRSLFSLVEVINGDPRHSDHRPVIIKLDGSCTEEVQNCQNRCFKFEARWLQEESCEDLVKKAWDEVFLLGATEVKDGLKGVAGVLTDWNRNVLGDLEKCIKRLKKEPTAWLRAPVTDQFVHKEQKDLNWKQSPYGLAEIR